MAMEDLLITFYTKRLKQTLGHRYLTLLIQDKDSLTTIRSTSTILVDSDKQNTRTITSQHSFREQFLHRVISVKVLLKEAKSKVRSEERRVGKECRVRWVSC